MKDRALDRMLRRLYPQASPPPDPALERELLERFAAQRAATSPRSAAHRAGSEPERAGDGASDRSHRPGREPAPARDGASDRSAPGGQVTQAGRHRRRLRSIALAASVLLVLGAATRAPAEYAVELGRRVEITLPAGARPPDPMVLEQALGHGARRQLRLRIRATPEATRVELDVFGDALPSPAKLEERIAAALPGLPAHAISVMPLDGRVRDTLGGAIRWEWLRLGASPAALARARAELIERIRRQEGPDAQVEVRVQDGQGRSRVEIHVERRRPSP